VDVNEFEDAVNRILGDKVKKILPDDEVWWKYHVPFTSTAVPDVTPQEAAEEYLAEMKALVRDRERARELYGPLESAKGYVEEDAPVWGIVGAWGSDI
jgi:hypothetical protein